MKEYGSFLELDLRRGNEYYSGRNIKRLNTARGGIYYTLRLLGLRKIILPKYLCPNVREFLLSKNIDVSYSELTGDLLPDLPPGGKSDTAVLAVNYFGLLTRGKLDGFIKTHQNVIIDCAQAFFNRPFDGAYTVYSPRKFFGVPDGCYVAGAEAGQEDFRLRQDCSADTALFLLKRLESGCEHSYPERMENEARLDNSDMAKMSPLTQVLLDNIDYEFVRQKRTENFCYAHRLFRDMNELDLSAFASEADTVPMVYPLVISNEHILSYLKQNKVFIGRLWQHVTALVPDGSLEMKLSKYMLPLPVDQRMGTEDIDRIYRLIKAARREDAFSYKSEK